MVVSNFAVSGSFHDGLNGLVFDLEGFDSIYERFVLILRKQMVSVPERAMAKNNQTNGTTMARF